MMREPWLVQRCEKCEWPFPNYKSVDRVIQPEYMGSAEFEFNVLPSSLAKMRESLAEYRIYKTDLATQGLNKGKPLHVLVKESDIPDLNDYLGKVTGSKHRLKEPTWLDKHFQKTEDFINIPWIQKTVVWWDIENHLFMSFHKHLLSDILDALRKGK